MITHNQTRRSFKILLAGVALAATMAATPINSAFAYQGNMDRATAALEQALAALRQATPNKGGHREQAMQLIESAIGEVQAGIDFANAHGGGGSD